MTTDELLAEIEHFLSRPGLKMTESTFGRLAVNDGKFVGRLRNGRGLTLATVEKVQSFMADYGRPVVSSSSTPEKTFSKPEAAE